MTNQTNENNPYQAPQSGSDVSLHDRHEMNDASKGKRFCTLLVDYACFFACTFVMGFIIALMFGPEFLEKGHDVLINVLSYLLFFVYFVFFEGIWGRTPGKFVCGTKVLMENGEVPSIGTILKRTLCRFIPFEPLSFFGKRGWHDSLSRTRVITVR